MKRYAWIPVLAALLLGGCVERELKITSQPEGAVVILSDVEVGRTPVTVPFTWYGDYDVMLRREGYETIKTHANLTPPWYELPPLDLLSAVAPWTYHDRRYLHYEMDKLEHPAEEELIERALRAKEETAKDVAE